MIKSMEQALDIQSLRVAQGKRGYSKAVRRYLRSISSPGGKFDWWAYNEHKQLLPHLDWWAYNEHKQLLPHLAIVPEPEPVEVNGNSVDYVPVEEAPKKVRKPRKSKQVEQVFDPTC